MIFGLCLKRQKIMRAWLLIVLSVLRMCVIG